VQQLFTPPIRRDAGAIVDGVVRDPRLRLGSLTPPIEQLVYRLRRCRTIALAAPRAFRPAWRHSPRLDKNPTPDTLFLSVDNWHSINLGCRHGCRGLAANPWPGMVRGCIPRITRLTRQSVNPVAPDDQGIAFTLVDVHHNATRVPC
jgi:hypothetical protein